LVVYLFLFVVSSAKLADNGQVFAMVGQESSTADSQSLILFQKPNIRTDVQKCSVSPKHKPIERTEVDVYSSPLLLSNTPVV